MTKSLATLTLTLLLAGTALAQQQPKRTAGNKTATGTAGTSSSTEAAQSNPSAVSPNLGANGASVGTGLTNDQQQAAGSAPNRTTKVDAQSSTRTSASTVKARKKSVKSGN